ncbi:MAG: septum formation initiator family protein [Alphaproteobacteria bacterium]|jgi:cell division protein FtsB|nr:septum formation initiator family protein [Alphaproteobacteria bacterium]
MTSKWAAGAMALATAYFAYHAFAGEQGLGKWTDMQARLADKKAVLKTLQAENAALRKDIARLMPGQVDLDLVEALARQELGFAYPDELIMIDRRESSAN